MPPIKIYVGGRSYDLLCDPGQETHVAGLAARFDEKLSPLMQNLPSAGDLRQMVLAALMLADELATVEAGCAALEQEGGALRVELAQAQRRLDRRAAEGQGRDLLARKEPTAPTVPPVPVPAVAEIGHADEILLAEALDLLADRIEAIADSLVKD